MCIVGKCWDYHVTEALRTDLDEGVAMVRDSVEYLVGQGRRVFFDAEHFFDGYKANPEFSLRVLEAAAMAGADCLVLCDTNGGSLPFDVERIVGEVVDYVDTEVGVHLHDDTGCGVANALAGVRGGATQVQGTINGYGERTGNCNLTTIIPDLSLKMGVATIPVERLERLTPVAHHVAELVNISPDPQQAFVGASAFAHKAGLHTSAIARRPDAYEHVDPDLVGNGTRFVVSELAGRSTLELKAQEIGLEIDGPALSDVVDRLKQLEYEGFHFEAADGSLELLMRDATGWTQPFFKLESFRVIVEHRAPADGSSGVHGAEIVTEATVKVEVEGQRVIATAEGNGPVNALDEALRKAMTMAGAHSVLGGVHLTDYKVRVLDTQKGTGAVTRVLIDSTDGERSWSTIGGQREHHRGLLAGPGRLHHLRPAAQPGLRSAGGRSAVRPRQGDRRHPALHLTAPAAGLLDPGPARRAPVRPAPRRPPRQPRAGPGLRPDPGRALPGPPGPSTRRERRRRPGRQPDGGPQAGVPVRPGPRDPRPDHRLHPLRLPRRAGR